MGLVYATLLKVEITFKSAIVAVKYEFFKKSLRFL